MSSFSYLFLQLMWANSVGCFVFPVFSGLTLMLCLPALCSPVVWSISPHVVLNAFQEKGFLVKCIAQIRQSCSELDTDNRLSGPTLKQGNPF